VRIIVGADHQGYLIREMVVGLLSGLGHTVEDLGTFNAVPVDYPDIAAKVAQQVSRGQADRGILVGGTGLGMCIVANKFPGVRAALCHDELIAEMSRRHNDANILCLAADILHEQSLDRLIQVWLDTAFDGGRHLRRVEKINALERKLLLG
jgi:ribose 5-phosphate isomerase B